jgi:hypothetical protein
LNPLQRGKSGNCSFEKKGYTSSLLYFEERKKGGAMNRRKDFFCAIYRKRVPKFRFVAGNAVCILSGRICPREGIKSTGTERQSGRSAFSQSFRAEKASGFLIV